MKKIIIGLSVVFILLSAACISRAEDVGANGRSPLHGTVTISGAWAIYPTAVAWAEAFQELHPRVRIDVSAGGAGKGAADAIAGLVDIGMVSREPDPSEIKKGAVPVYILNDAVYPVISDKNPALNELLKKGIKKQTLIDIYINGITTAWHPYTRSDSCGAAASWAGYLGKKQEDLKGIGVYGDPGLLETVKRDYSGIGYNNFSYVFDRQGNLASGIRLLPIDSNENGIADPDEIYQTRDEAIKGIRAKWYPAARKNYFFVKGKPTGLVKEFIIFALSDEGTKIVDDVGASLPLDGTDREKVLRSLE